MLRPNSLSASLSCANFSAAGSHVNGRFSAPQREVYELVLAAQQVLSRPTLYSSEGCLTGSGFNIVM